MFATSTLQSSFYPYALITRRLFARLNRRYHQSQSSNVDYVGPRSTGYGGYALTLGKYCGSRDDQTLMRLDKLRT